MTSVERQPITQPSTSPTAKVAAGGAAGSVTVLIVLHPEPGSCRGPRRGRFSHHGRVDVSGQLPRQGPPGSSHAAGQRDQELSGCHVR